MHTKINKVKQLWHFLHKHIIVVLVMCVVTFVLGAGTVFAAVKTQSPLEPAYMSEGHPVNQPFVIRLGQVLAKVEQLSIEPEIAGEWYYHADMFGVKGVEFRPDTEFNPGQRYIVRAGEMTRYATGMKDMLEVHFTTEEAPGVLHFSVPPKESRVVAADEKFSIQLRNDGAGLRDVVLESDPVVEFTRTDKAQGYMWSSASLLPQGVKLTVRVKDALSKEVILERIVTVASAPSISSISQELDLVPGGVVTVAFSAPIVAPPKDAIIFDAPGDGLWTESGVEYQYTLGEIEPGKEYAWRVKSGLRTKEGGVLAAQIDKALVARGAVGVAGVTPTGSELAQARQQIAITFNQPVDKTIAEKAFSISSGRITGVTWHNNTMKTAVESLGYQQQVRVSLAPGVRPSGFGLESGGWSYVFTTEVPTVRLSVPYYKQVYAQSCEASSVRMALAYRGTHSSDWDILQRFGYNPTTKNHDANTWDDPQKQFVGDVNGNQGKGTGWGVYAEPVASTVRSFGRGATVQYGVSAQWLAQQIHSDRPVVLWGIWGSSAQIQTWNLPSGGTAAGPFPMHVRLVVGVKGSVDNPLGFYVHDPITGSAYWSTSQLMSNTYKAGPANQAVAIH